MHLSLSPLSCIYSLLPPSILLIKDRYLLDAASGRTFMSKFKDDVMELIETMALNRHQNSGKLFERGVMPIGQLINAKSAKMGMLLERIEKMAEVRIFY